MDYDPMFGDPDPYEMLLEMRELLLSLTANHNSLVEDYKRTINRLGELEKDCTRLKFAIEDLHYKMEKIK